MYTKFIKSGALLLSVILHGELNAVENHELLHSVIEHDKVADSLVTAIKTPAELQTQQKQWRNTWQDMLGGLPERTPLHTQSMGVIQCDGYKVEKILFQSQPGVYVAGLLYLPANENFTPPYPALLMVHGHSDNGKMRDGYRRMAILAVQAGFGVFAPDPISQGERVQAPERFGKWFENCSTEHASLGARSWLVGWNFARFRIWDGVRSIDFMETRKELDLSRLAIAGNSGGGTMSTYLQAWDNRIKVACPSCFVSSMREVIRERGVHDAEQFFYNQLPAGINHAVLLALGQPRVDLMIGARHDDYFPMEGVRSTYNVMKTLHGNLNFSSHIGLYSCDGPHGWVESSRQATLAWLLFHVKGETTQYCGVKNGEFYWNVNELRRIPGNFDFGADKLPFSEKQGNVTLSGQVHDLPGFKSLYTIIAEESARLAHTRKMIKAQGKEKLRETVRRRANIHSLDKLPPPPAPFAHNFKWWYLKGAEGTSVELYAGILAVEGKALVGIRAEDILRNALEQQKTNGGRPIQLKAQGTMCIAAAHAYAAEPQLFSSVEFENPPSSWEKMLENPDPRQDSFAVTVWGAMQEYDWVDLVPQEKLIVK